MTNPYIPKGEHRARLLDALKAAMDAGNPVMEASIRACLNGTDFNMRDYLPPMHPEIEEVVFPKDDA